MLRSVQCHIKHEIAKTVVVARPSDIEVLILGVIKPSRCLDLVLVEVTVPGTVDEKFQISHVGEGEVLTEAGGLCYCKHLFHIVGTITLRFHVKYRCIPRIQL